MRPAMQSSALESLPPAVRRSLGKLGADIATIPPAVLFGLARHPLTDKGIEDKGEAAKQLRRVKQS